MNSTIKAAAGLLFTVSAALNPAYAAPDITIQTIPLNTYAYDPQPSISADGRYVAFMRQIRVIGSNPGPPDMYVHDLLTGARVQANLTLAGKPAPAGSNCAMPVMNATGRYVVFGCIASFMGATSVGGSGTFIYDKTTNTTQMIPDTGTDRPVNNNGSAISADGRFIAFRTFNQTGAVSKIYVRDTVNKTTTLTGAQTVSGNATRMSISNDGRYIAYLGRASVMTGVPLNVSLFDRVTGVTEAIDVRPDGSRSTSTPSDVSMSEDGSVVAFISLDANLVAPPATTGQNYVYIRDRKTGTTERVGAAGSGFSVVSGNGRYVAYIQGGVEHVYDRLTKLTRNIVVPGYATTGSGRFSSDGRYLAYTTGSGSGPLYSITVADLGVAAGVALSTAQLSLTEGGIAGTYTVVLTQAPDADVKVKVAPDNQLSVARTELVFTPANWNVPQVVSVQAIQDGVVEGAHSGVITHTVTSTDVNYSVVTASTVTVAITDAIVPTLVLPGATWNQTDLPLNGTAAPNATVLLTATNRNTGWSTAISTVADAQGRWSYTLTGLTDGVIEFDVQADGLHGLPKTITVALPAKTIDVTASIKRTAYGLVFNRSTGLYVGDFVLTNIGSAALSGPLQLEFDSLTAGVTLTNASGTHNGAPYIAVAEGLATGASVTVSLQFSNPAKGAVEYVEKIYSGSF